MNAPVFMQPGLPGIGPADDGSVRNLFFGLKPDNASAAAMASAVDAIEKTYPAMGRRIKRHRLHMTLLYIDTFSIFPDNVVRNATQAGDQVAASAFDLTLDTTGSFPNGDAPWWLGCRDKSAALVELHRQLFFAMRSMREKVRGGSELVPHVTISRRNQQPLESMPIDPILWRVGEFCLIDSVFGASNFRVLKTWTLSQSD